MATTRMSVYEMPLRDFQVEVIELARQQNVVMVGETGIGKTYVAIALLGEQDYSDGKRAFFMAPTRQLVQQITAKIRQATTLRVEAYCGREMDLWDEYQWKRELETARVLVCTPEVVRSILEKGYVSMARINLLVFDECHHVTKRHPYAQLLKLYEEGPDMPRIFGTTSCPTKHCAEHLHATLHKVDLESKKATRFAASAPIVLETYDPQPNVSAPALEDANEGEVDNWEARIFGGSIFAQLAQELEETKAVPVLDLLLKKGTSQAARNATYRAKMIQKFKLTCAQIYEELGAWCLFRYIEIEIEKCASNASGLLRLPGSYAGLNKDAVTTMMIARSKYAECEMAASNKVKKIIELIRPQVIGNGVGNKLEEELTGNSNEEDDAKSSDDSDESDSGTSGQDELSDSTNKNTEKKKLQGIVFVKTRVQCRVLADYLNEVLGGGNSNPIEEDDSDDDNDSEVIQERAPVFACILGQPMERDAACFDLPRMEKTLAQFESGRTQFLVSTAVSIEGVDFPLCSCVVVANRVDAARQLIQLRGRARHEDGIVYYLVEEGDLSHCVHFQQLQKEAEAISRLDFCHDKEETLAQIPHAQAADTLIGFALSSSDTSMRMETTGAVLDLDSSVSCVNQFIQSLPDALYTKDFKGMYTFQPISVANRPMFRATLILPEELNAPPFVSKKCQSKSLAKAGAAFLACQHLVQEKYLDESFNSVYRKGKTKLTQHADSLDFFLKRLASPLTA